MSHITREEQYRVKFALENGRDATAREVANALHIHVARRETIAAAVHAIKTAKPVAVEHIYNLSAWKEDNRRCLVKLLQLQH